MNKAELIESIQAALGKDATKRAAEDAVSAVRLTDEAGETLFLQREVGSSDRAFRPAPPFQNYRLTSRLAVTGPAMALTRFLPVGVHGMVVGLEPEHYDARVATASLEMGHTFNVRQGAGSSLYVQPQLQLTVHDAPPLP